MENMNFDDDLGSVDLDQVVNDLDRRNPVYGTAQPGDDDIYDN